MKHAERLLWLYEQQTNKKATPMEVAGVLGAYVKRWRRWCNAGLGSVVTVSLPDGGMLPNRPSLVREGRWMWVRGLTRLLAPFQY